VIHYYEHSFVVMNGICKAPASFIRGQRAFNTARYAGARHCCPQIDSLNPYRETMFSHVYYCLRCLDEQITFALPESSNFQIVVCWLFPNFLRDHTSDGLGCSGCSVIINHSSLDSANYNYFMNVICSSKHLGQ
jgi:hypothetical protein